MKYLVLTVFAVLTALNSIVLAQPELDTTFAGTGKRILNWGALASTDDMVVQPDKKIVLVSACSGISFGSRPFCMVRLNEDGSFDTTFGGGVSAPGSVVTIVGSSGVTGVALQIDGKLVLVGGGSNLVLVRYNSDGSQDSSFGTGGVVTTGVTAGSSHLGNKVAIQADGKIVVVGFTNNGGPSQQYIARYLLNGTLDDTFGTGGIARTTVSASGLSVALQPDGKILAGGASAATYQLARVNSDGTPDTSWDTDGVLNIPYTVSGVNDEGIRSIAVRPDGRVVALGHGNVIYRLNPDGSPDPTFAGDGSIEAFIGVPGPDPNDLIVTAGGLITVVGGRRGSAPRLYRIARHLANGSPDLSFSDDGFLEFSVELSSNAATAIAVDSLGRAVVGGLSSNCCIQNPFEQAVFSVARLVAIPTAVVGVSGRVTRSDGQPATNTHLTIQTAGGIVVGSALTNPFGYYRFANVQAGQSYTISVRAKGLVFIDREIAVADDVVNFDFVAEP